MVSFVTPGDRPGPEGGRQLDNVVDGDRGGAGQRRPVARLEQAVGHSELAQDLVPRPGLRRQGEWFKT